MVHQQQGITGQLFLLLVNQQMTGVTAHEAPKLAGTEAIAGKGLLLQRQQRG